MSDFDKQRDVDAEGPRALMAPSKPDLSNMGKSTAWKIGYRQGQADTLSTAQIMADPRVAALVDALKDAIELAHGVSFVESQIIADWGRRVEQKANAAISQLKAGQTNG